MSIIRNLSTVTHAAVSAGFGTSLSEFFYCEDCHRTSLWQLKRLAVRAHMQTPANSKYNTAIVARHHSKP
jgi:hypothetical protein